MKKTQISSRNFFINIGISMLVILFLCAPQSAKSAIFDNLEHSSIVAASCNPNVGAGQPGNCAAANITVENFAIKIKHAPGVSVTDYTTGWLSHTCESNWPLLPPTNYCAERVGDKMCAVAYIVGIKMDIAKINLPNSDSRNNDGNCVHMPMPPLPNIQRSWSRIISPACYLPEDPIRENVSDNYQTVARWHRPFLSSIALCIEDTMYGLFGVGEPISPNSVMVGRQFFQTLQRNITPLFLTIMTLAVMLIGIQVLLTQKIIPASEMTWNILRFAMVIYVVTGNAIPTYGPMLINGSKEIAVMLFHSTNSINQTPTTAPSSNSGRPFWETRRDTRNLTLEGYNYCNFSEEGLRAAGIQQYAPGRKSFEIWDTLDCKFAKYLGIGDGLTTEDPKTLIVALTALYSSSGTFLTTAFGLMYLGFIFSFAFRVFFGFIIAIVFAQVLLYIAPLIVPFILFKFTRKFYDAWLKEFLSYLIQPIILVAGLAVAFAAIDGIYFGGNHNFLANSNGDYVIKRLPATPDPSTGITPPGECPDLNAPACLIENAVININSCPLGNWCSLPVLENVNGTALLQGFAIMALVAFILYSIAGILEMIPQTLTDSITNLAAQSPVNNFSPTNSVRYAGKAVSSAAGIATGVLGMADKLILGGAATKATRSAAQRMTNTYKKFNDGMTQEIKTAPATAATAPAKPAAPANKTEAPANKPVSPELDQNGAS